MRSSSKHSSSALLAIVLLLLLGPALAVSPGKPFTSPLKNFSLVVPTLPFGTRAREDHTKDVGSLRVLGESGDLRRIDYARLPPSAIPPTDAAGQVALGEQSLQSLIASHPSTLLSKEPLQIDGLDVLFALVLFPEGSHLQDSSSGKRLNSTRGLLFFTKGGFQYVLYVEVSGGIFAIGKPPRDPGAMARVAKGLLEEFYRLITFH